MSGFGIKRFGENAFWMTMGSGIRLAAGVVASIFVGRYLGPDKYGEYDLVNSTISLLSIFADTGMTSTAVRYLGAYEKEDPNKAQNIASLSIQVMVLIGFVLSTLLFFGSSIVANIWLKKSSLAPILKFASLPLLLVIVAGSCSSVIRGLSDFKGVARVELSSAIISSVLMILGAKKFGVLGALLGITFSHIWRSSWYVLIVVRHFWKRKWSLKLKRAWSERAVITRYSLPAFMSGILFTPILWLVRFILARQPGGYHELGLFSVALQWQIPITFFSGVVSTVAMPLLSELFQKGEKQQLIQTVSVIFQVTTVLLLPITVGLVLISHHIVGVYGKGFQSALLPFVLVICAAFFKGSVAVFSCVFASIERMWLDLILNVIWAIALIGGSLAMVSNMGVVGIAIAFLSAYLLYSICSLFLAGRCLTDNFIKDGLAVFSVGGLAVGSTAYFMMHNAVMPAAVTGLITLVISGALGWSRVLNVARTVRVKD